MHTRLLAGPLVGAVLAAGSIFPGAGPAIAETGLPVLDQTPNLDGPDPTPVGRLDFPFAHRFQLLSGKLVSSPTFALRTGLRDGLDLGVRYASSSEINGAINEWEALARWRLSPAEAPWGLMLEGGYNAASRSPDGALAGRVPLGPLELLANVRGFGSGYGVGGPTLAAGGGLVWRLNPALALAGDLNGIVAAGDRAAIGSQLPSGMFPAWSLALQCMIPASPHTLSLYATNANTRTLEGMSRGGAEIRYGFEFWVPIVPAHLVGIVRPAS